MTEGGGRGEVRWPGQQDHHHQRGAETGRGQLDDTTPSLVTTDHPVMVEEDETSSEREQDRVHLSGDSAASLRTVPCTGDE